VSKDLRDRGLASISMAICKLTARRLVDVVVHECWGGPCTVELRPSAQAPVYRLPLLEMPDGLHWCADFSVPQQAA
jgi:acetoacetate decarboxylase